MPKFTRIETRIENCPDCDKDTTFDVGRDAFPEGDKIQAINPSTEDAYMCQDCEKVFKKNAEGVLEQVPGRHFAAQLYNPDKPNS